MTQENDAADRAQKINDVSDETTAAANESFAQDWLDAEEKERAEQTNAAARPRFVATLPDWATFGKTEGEKKERGAWRETFGSAKLRTLGIALAAFGLGAFCASGNGRVEKSNESEGNVAASEMKNDAETDVAFENGFAGLSDDSFASIDSSTLRSVPNSASVDFLSQTGDGSLTASNNAAGSNVWGNGGVLANVNVGANGEAASTADAFGALTTAQAPAPNAVAEADSNWRRGVDFQRDVETPTVAAANVESFPTWDDLGANVPSVAEILNSPIETAAPVATAPIASNVANNYYPSENLPVAQNAAVAAAPVASSVANNYYPSENAPVAQNAAIAAAPSVGGSADYAAYNGNAGYQGGDSSNLNVGASQFAGNSQNSGYNQTNGSENFAGWPTTAPVAPSLTANTAPVAPGSTADYASVAPSLTANTAPVAPGSTADYASVAPSLTANAAPVAPGAVPNYATSAPTAAPRAMVAQAPNDNAPNVAPNAPAAQPNLRW